MMRGLAKNAGIALLVNVIKQQLAPSHKHAGQRYNVFAGGLAFCGGVLVILAEYQWLNTIYAQELATLFTGLTLIGLSAVTYLSVLTYRAYTRRKNAQKEVPGIEDAKAIFEELAGEDVTELIKDNPKIAVAISAAAGLAAGRQI
jgi:ElaB/YqjD/DUF883 family membrane-anchored ribosome-binding protein